MRERLRRSVWAQGVVVALVALAVYVPFLGARPLDNSEGHRAVPGWTMLRTGEWWRQEMFGLTYLRKPPGMAWAIGASSSVLGENEWGARAPSAVAAVLASLVAVVFVTRWMGRPWGMAAGLAQALMPLMWSAGRTAEIEMVDVVGGQLLAFGVIDVLREWWGGGAGRRQGGRGAGGQGGGEQTNSGGGMLGVGAIAVGLVVSGLAKGPANVPVLVGAVVGAGVVARSWRVVGEWRVWVGLVVGGGVLGVIAWKVLGANGGPDAVREDVAGKFLWSWGRVGGVLTLLPAAWGAALPGSLAWALVWVRASRADDAEVAGAERAARVCAWAWLAGMAVLVVAGVSNPRYAMPLAVLMPPIAAWALMVGVRGAWAERWRGVGRAVTFGGRAWAWGAVMGMGAWWWMVLTQVSPTEDQRAGVEAAGALAEAVPQWAGPGGTAGLVIWADDAVEARPDVLWRLQEGTPGARVTWAKGAMLNGELPPAGAFVLLRTDAESGEAGRYREAINGRRLEQCALARVRTGVYALYRVSSADR